MNDLILTLLPLRARPYAKSWLALIGVVLSVLAATYGDSKPLMVAVQIATALGVYGVKNGSDTRGKHAAG